MARNSQNRPESDPVEQPELTTAEAKEPVTKTEPKEKRSVQIIPRQPKKLPASVLENPLIKGHVRTGRVIARKAGDDHVELHNQTGAILEVLI